MQEHSKAAWHIASLYSGVLASETRDLAAHIDMAIAGERERCAAIAAGHNGRSPKDARDIAAKIRIPAVGQKI